MLKDIELQQVKWWSNNLAVITWEYEGEEKFKKKIIKFIPLWRWLVEFNDSDTASH